MKKILTIGIMSLMAMACTTTPNYKISGTIEGLADGPIYLQVMDGKTPRGIDTVNSLNGVFAFDGTLEMPMFARIATPEGPVTTFFLENSPIAVTGKWDVKDSIQVVGSATNDIYNNYMAQIETATNRDEAVKINEDFIKNNPSSIAAAYVLFRRMSPAMDYKELREKVAMFDSTISSSIYLVMAGEMADRMEKVDIGRPFVDFTLPDTTGTMIALSSVAGKGNYVLLDFWASWCGPCRAENPHVVESFEQFSSKGFTVFGVSLDNPDGREKWLKAINDDKLNWTNVSDLKRWNCEPAIAYGVRSIPSNVLIGPDGNILASNLRGAALTEKLTELLGAPAPVKKK